MNLGVMELSPNNTGDSGSHVPVRHYALPVDARDQRGITGLETAIVLIAFVVVSSVFAFAALSTGLFASQTSGDALGSGMFQARSSLVLRGAVIAEDTDTDGNLDKVYFHVSIPKGGAPVDLTPGDTTVESQEVV